MNIDLEMICILLLGLIALAWSAPQLDELPADLRRKILYKHGLSLIDRARTGRVSRSLNLEDGDSNVLKNQQFALSNLHSKCDDILRLGYLKMDGSSELLLNIRAGGYPISKLDQCFLFAKEYLEEFYPVRAFGVHVYDGINSTVGFYQRFLDHLITDEAFRNSVERAYFSVFSFDSELPPATLYCQFVDFVESLPNLKSIEPGTIIYPPDEPAEANQYHECATRLTKILQGLNVQSIFVQRDNYIPLTDPEFGISSWQRLHNIRYVTPNLGIDPDLVSRMTETLHSMRRPFTLSVAGKLEGYMADWLLAPNLATLHIQEMHQIDKYLISNMTRVLEERTAGISKIRIDKHKLQSTRGFLQLLQAIIDHSIRFETLKTVQLDFSIQGDEIAEEIEQFIEQEENFLKDHFSYSFYSPHFRISYPRQSEMNTSMIDVISKGLAWLIYSIMY